MGAIREPLVAALVAGILGMSSAGWAQSPDPAGPSLATAPQSPAANGPDGPAAGGSQESAAALAAAAPAGKNYTVPAGTKVLLTLRSAVNTKSAKPGDGVYLGSTFPVVVGNRVMIPSGVYVQGVVDRVERAGRVKGRAQLDMHFTSIIFPNGSVVEVPGMVNNLPGATDQTVKNDGEGTVEQNPNKTRNAGKVGQVSVPTGATIGAIGGLHSGHPLGGGLAGVGAGLAVMGLA